MTVHAQAFVYPSDPAPVTVKNGEATIRFGEMAVYFMAGRSDSAAMLRALAEGCTAAARELEPFALSSEDVQDAPLAADGLPDVPKAAA